MLSVLNYLISKELFPSVKEFVCPCLQIKCLRLPWDKADPFKNLKTQTSPLEHTCETAADFSELRSWLGENLVQSLFNLVERSCKGSSGSRCSVSCVMQGP